ncbi:unnamed protein product [Gadus morhua 'NCC']
MGGHCSLSRASLAAEGDHKSPLQSWCASDAIFSLLPRIRHGLFNNTPLISECHTEGMLRAFSQHVLHRLHIPQDGPKGIEPGPRQ